MSDLAAPFQMTRQTIHDYVTVLERVFLVDRLPPWHSSRLSPLVKTAKRHMGDNGLACALLGIDALAWSGQRLTRSANANRSYRRRDVDREVGLTRGARSGDDACRKCSPGLLMSREQDSCSRARRLNHDPSLGPSVVGQGR